MNDRAIVGVGVGSWYPRGLDRLKTSARACGFDGDLLLWRDEYPPGSPTHQEQPYAFKLAALEMAMVRGYGATLWCDSSMRFIRDPDPVFEVIEQRGYWFMSQGWRVSTWCTDEVLPKLGITREEGVDMPMVAATMFGLDLRGKVARDVLGWMHARCQDGSFRGPWRIDDGLPDDDPMKVRGHRHDQTALSVIVDKLELDIDWHPSWFEYDYGKEIQNSKCLALARGM